MFPIYCTHSSSSVLKGLSSKIPGLCFNHQLAFPRLLSVYSKYGVETINEGDTKHGLSFEGSNCGFFYPEHNIGHLENEISTSNALFSPFPSPPHRIDGLPSIFSSSTFSSKPHFHLFFCSSPSPSKNLNSLPFFSVAPPPNCQACAQFLRFASANYSTSHW